MEQSEQQGLTRWIGPAISALLVLCVSVALWYFPKEYANDINHPKGLDPVEPGVWDLRGFELDDYNIFVRGPSEYVLGALLTPEEFDAYEGEIQYGWVPEAADQVATVRLTLYLPQDKVYSMVSTSVEYNERVYINGVWRHDVGSPALTEAQSVAASGYKRIDAMPQEGVVQIVRQSSNFAHKESGGYTGVYVGSPDNIARMMDIEKLFAAFGVGLYLCLFLLHMVLYLVLRGYRPNLWFALICLAWLLRAGFTGRFIYWAMFPGVPWTLTYRLGCVSIGFTGAMLMLLVRDQFAGVVQTWPLRIYIAAQIPLTLFYLIAGTEQCSRVKIASEILLYAAAAYLLVRFILVLPRQIRQRQLFPEQLITLAGLAVAVFALIHDVVRYNNWLPGIFYYEIGDVGVMILVLFQMAAMVFGTLRQLTNAQQTAKIAWMTAEISQKNKRLLLLRAENAEKDLELHKQMVASIPPENLVAFDQLVLNTEKSQAFLKDRDLQLSPKEFLLLLYLIRHHEESASREALYEAVWLQPYVSSDRAFDSNMYRLRKKMEGSGYGIVHARGEGYRLEEE